MLDNFVGVGPKNRQSRRQKTPTRREPTHVVKAKLIYKAALNTVTIKTNEDS
jgi:hypothetical protein